MPKNPINPMSNETIMLVLYNGIKSLGREFVKVLLLLKKRLLSFVLKEGALEACKMSIFMYIIYFVF